MKNNFTVIIKNKVLSALNENSMLQDVKTVVVGFSGGADSVCLLHILNELKNQLEISVKAIHINHDIRGEEAKRDENFAVDFCKERKIPCKTELFDCIGEAKLYRESLEECGRRVRYGFFKKETEKGFTRVATAHNADDNAETVIFNISRGSSYKGACGIPPVRDYVIRPLIYCTRVEIEGYCEENNLQYVTDSTNLSDDYTRNKIRHKILPVTKELNSSSIDNFSFFSQSAREAAQYINFQAENALKSAFISENTYNTGELKKLHNAVLNECIAIAFNRFSENSITREKLNVIKNLILSGGRAQLYGSERVEVVKNKLRFYKEIRLKEVATEFVSFSENNIFGEYTVKFTEFTDCSNLFDKNILDNLIDCDKIEGNLFLRSRKDGDKFTLPNRNITKTLKNLFNEYSVPVEQRKFLPLLCDDKGIVWIYGIGVCARCRQTSKSKNIMLIKGEKND